jgi:hypothetical protein
MKIDASLSAGKGTSQNFVRAKFLRIYLLSTWVNRGKKKGRGVLPRPPELCCAFTLFLRQLDALLPQTLVDVLELGSGVGVPQGASRAKVAHPLRREGGRDAHRQHHHHQGHHTQQH